MSLQFNPQARKKSANLSINSDLLDKAKSVGINLSAVLEQALLETLKHKQRERWLNENREAMGAYNRHVEAHGVFGDRLRSF